MQFSSLALLLCACGRVGFDPAALRFGDANTDVVGDANVPLGPFGPFATPVEQVTINTVTREYGTAVSSDGLEVVWSSFRTPSSGLSDLWSARRTDRSMSFDNPKHLAALASNDDDAEPSLSGSGTAIYFDRYLPAPRIYTSTRPDVAADDWSTPVALETPEANLLGFGGADFGPGDLRLVVVELSTHGLYEATRPDVTSPWGVPQLLPGLGRDPSDGYPAVRGDDLEIFWESSRQPPLSVYRATRNSIDEPFGTPERVSLGPAVDAGSAGDPDISADGRVLVFVSNASAGLGGEYDVYVATREPL